MENETSLFSKIKREIFRAYSSFRRTEKMVFFAIFGAVIVSAFMLIQNINRLAMLEVPTYGGSFTEGIIGTPRFINPILALSDADRDAAMLAYSGLLRKTADGGYIPDLAEKYEVSPDGLTYTFTLKDNLTFQDGSPLTTDDVEFTVNKAKDPIIKSPKRPNWEGVAVQKTDSKTISFILKQPYAQFLGNTTLGILPKKLWKEVPDEQWNFSDYNLKGIGSGPFEIDSVIKDSAGVPVEISLSAFKKFALGRPYIDGITLKFYGNEDELLNALKNGSVDNVNAIMPKEAKDLEARGVQIKRYPLPRAYGVFFNQGSVPALSDLPVRTALDTAVDRVGIVNSVLYGYGIPLFGPIPKSNSESLLGSGNPSAQDDLASRAKTLLINNGWKMSTSTNVMTKKTKKDTSELSFSISTLDKPELRAAAEMIKSDWEKIGVKTSVKVFEQGDFNQNVIRPRKYDALLFGEVIGEDSDPYAFWHSSQRNDPGLNIALYANPKTDKLLEDARATLDATERKKKISQFEDYIREDVPAVFVYSPDFIYVRSKDIRGMDIGQLTVPAERFLNVYRWYSDTDWVWKIFSPKENS